MLKKIAIALLVVITGFVGFVSVQPAEFRVERSRTMQAPAYVAFNLVNNLRRWQQWSPWEGRDPDMQRTFDGPEVGVGSTYAWDGNQEVGKGRMTITESDLEKSVGLRLEFLEPFEATNTTRFTFESAEGGVTVRWAMEGQNGFLGKLMCLFVDMDAVVGKDFEQGLDKLQALAEAEAREIEKAKAQEALAAAKAKVDAQEGTSEAAAPAAPSDATE